jgi:hypothetical protein
VLVVGVVSGSPLTPMPATRDRSAVGWLQDLPALTWILGQGSALRFIGWEAEAEFAAVEPWDWGGLVGEAGGDQDGVVGAQLNERGQVKDLESGEQWPADLASWAPGVYREFVRKPR